MKHDDFFLIKKINLHHISFYFLFTHLAQLTEKIFHLFRENIVVVQFFYQEMKEENVKQEPSYDFYKLVGK